MLISPNSLTITASFLPCCSLRIRLMSVVLPEPRKPVTTVAGMRVSAFAPLAGTLVKRTPHLIPEEVENEGPEVGSDPRLNQGASHFQAPRPRDCSTWWGPSPCPSPSQAR